MHREKEASIMQKNDSLYASLTDKKIVPVLKVADPNNSEQLADALTTGGLSVAEVTFRTDCAAEVIERMKNSRPGMYVGAGTVLTTAQVDDAKAAGADFIVSPGFDADVVLHCQKVGIAVVPGCVTPTEIQAAISLGISIVKFFPASAFGGAATIKALSAPFSGISFIPTGGIDLSNMKEYLSLPCVLAIGGSFMATEKLISAHAWDEIAARTRSAMSAACGIHNV